MSPAKFEQPLVNHFCFVLDASSSMQEHTRALIKVVDDQVKHLGRRSQELQQETRVTIYRFSWKHSIECLVWETDVLRLPSIEKLYHANGNTALVDAMMLALTDMGTVPQKYGDHAFILYAVTDGYENESRHTRPQLADRIKALGSNWTVAALVPDLNGIIEAKSLGVPAGNCAVWNTASKMGVEEMGKAIRTSTDNYMTNRATRTAASRTSTGLFDMSQNTVNASTIAAAALQPMDRNLYMLIPVPPPRPENPKNEIKPFVEAAGLTFTVGQVFVPLRDTRANRIAPGKKLMIHEKSTDRVFSGDGVRAMVGLPDTQTTVRGTFNPLFNVYMQSTSVNRHLETGTHILYVK